MLWVRRILWGGLIVGLLLGSHFFVRKNSETVNLEFVAFRFEEVALWLVLLCTFAAGVGVASLLALLRGARLRLEARRYRKEARNLEAEVHQLRTLPLTGAEESTPEAVPGDGLSRGT